MLKQHEPGEVLSLFDFIAPPNLAFLRGNVVLKRCFDIVLSASSLVLLSPLLAILALLIRITSRGPVLFRQLRTGRDLRPFYILKFRTMLSNANGPAFTLDLDPRITPLGYWLRRTKLDELPQLWNILRGEMSFVGPRPLMPELIDPNCRSYRRLFRVRPGLTDPASIKYVNEGFLLQHVEDPERFFLEVIARDKVRLSLAYQRSATLVTDLKLIAHTIRICHQSIVQSAIQPRTDRSRPRAHRPATEQP